MLRSRYVPTRIAFGSVFAVLATGSAKAQSLYTVGAPAPPGYDRALGQRATREHLERLIRLDTQNPPVNELITACYFDSVFKRILPMPLSIEDELRMHGDNERVPVAALGWAGEYLYRVLLGVM